MMARASQQRSAQMTEEDWAKAIAANRAQAGSACVGRPDATPASSRPSTDSIAIQAEINARELPGRLGGILEAIESQGKDIPGETPGNDLPQPINVRLMNTNDYISAAHMLISRINEALGV